MSKSLREMLIGVLLVLLFVFEEQEQEQDAHIRRVGLDKAYITFEQAKAKSDYLNHLHKLTQDENLANDIPKLYSRIDPRYNKLNESLQFRTKTLDEFKPLADLFLDNEGNKIVPSSIAEYLTPRSLAYWIMDDGQQVKRGGVTLCTDSFKEDEINVLQKALNDKFNLITSIHHKKGKGDTVYDRIYIKKDSLEGVKPSILEHMQDSMLYKLNAQPISLGEIIEASQSTVSLTGARSAAVGVISEISDICSSIGDF